MSARSTTVYAFHRDTFLRHGHEPYLTREFFSEVVRTMGDALMVKTRRARAHAGGRGDLLLVAGGARSAATGARRPITTACISRPAITRASSSASSAASARFEPGTQGEHKVSRGFEPAFTWSAHFIANGASARRSRSTSRARAHRSMPTRRKCRCTCRIGTSADASDEDLRMKIDHLALAARSAGCVSRRLSRRWRSHAGCWPPAAICPLRACWRPISAASSRGTHPASRCCGGRRIRARCCFRRNSAAAAASRKTRAQRRLHGRDRSGLRCRHRRCARAPRPQPRDLDHPEMRGAYVQLHELGFAHSLETYRNDVLVGGLYGVRLGGVFFGESMFSRERDASKVALAQLVRAVSTQRHRGDRLPAALTASGQPGQPCDRAPSVPGAAARACHLEPQPLP